MIGTLGWREEQGPGIEAKRWHFWVYSGSSFTKQGSRVPALRKQRPIDKCIQECLSLGVGQVTVSAHNANSTAKRPFLFHKHCKMLTAQDIFDKWSLGTW